jgi:hypothetical protein
VPYIVLPITVERAELAEAGYDVLRAAYPGWEPADGHVEAIVIDATAEIGADVAYAVSAVGGLPTGVGGAQHVVAGLGQLGALDGDGQDDVGH